MAKESFYQSLTRLFKSGPQIKRKIKGNDEKLSYDARVAQSRLGYYAPSAFRRDHSPFSGMNSFGVMDRISRYSTFAEMEYRAEIACITGETEISTLKGTMTMNELIKEYPNGESFQVWSWDKDSAQITIGNAHHPRKTGTKEVIKILLDNNQFLECTEDHRILLIDGTYKQAGLLKPNDSLMPFYYKEEEYLKIRTKSGKYKPAHRYIFEDIFQQNIGKNNVHHINEIKLDNRTENLVVLSALEHMKIHHISFETNRKRKKSSVSSWSNEEYRKKCLKPLKDWQNSEEGKKFMSEHASFINKERWKTNEEYRQKMIKIFSNNLKSLWNDPLWKEWKRKQHSETMKLKYANDPGYAKITSNFGKDNGNFNNDITNESILEYGQNFITLNEFIKNFNFKLRSNLSIDHKRQFIKRRLLACGFNSWQDYKSNYKHKNHKVISILREKKVVDVYDLTVDHFENFCLKSGIIISNCALDVYGDESTSPDESGKCFHIYSNNPRVQKALEELFYEICNIEYDARRWARNLVKYGDFFLYLEVSEGEGVVAIEPIPVNEVDRIEGYDPNDRFAVKFSIQHGRANYLENWQVLHFRNVTNELFLPFGTSFLDAAMRPWRVLSMMEDAMLVYRIVRCLHGDSNVWTSNGYKKIKDIKVGEQVFSFDFTKKKLVLSTVTDWINNGNQQIWEIKSENKTLKTNFNHPILARDCRTGIIDYINVCALKPGIHQLTTPTIEQNYHQSCKIGDIKPEFETILEVGPTDEYSDVYDIRVDNNLHNFIADGCVVHNSPERRVFYIDVSAVSPNDIPSYMEGVKQEFMGNGLVDRLNGKEDFRYEPISVLKDYFLPTRPNNLSKIETLQGGQHVSAVEDVEYIQKQLIAALKVPKPYLTFDEAVSSKSTLAQIDIRFSRLITGIQKIMIAELNKLAIIHLYSKGFTGNDLTDFELRFSNPSSVALQQRLALWTTKFDTAAKAMESKLVDSAWIQKELLGLQPDEIDRIKEGLEEDAIAAKKWENIEIPAETASGVLDQFDGTSYEIPSSPNLAQYNQAQQQAANNDPKLKMATGPSIETAIRDGHKSNLAPLKANPTPNLNKAGDDRSRRVQFTGARALSMPNFAKAVSAKDKYISDPFDKHSLMEEYKRNNPTSLTGFSPLLDPSTKSLLKKMDEALGITAKQIETLQILKEEVEPLENSVIDLKELEAELLE